MEVNFQTIYYNKLARGAWQRLLVAVPQAQPAVLRRYKNEIRHNETAGSDAGRRHK